MPDISQSLQGKDLQFLNNIAVTWGIELQTHDLRSTIQETSKLHEPEGAISGTCGCFG